MIKTNRQLIVGAFFVILLTTIWSILVYYKGAIVAIDNINLHIPWADAFIKHNFNVFEFLATDDDRASPLLYLFWVAIVAVCRLLLGENWAVGIVSLNLLSGIFFAVLLLKIAWSTTSKLACVIFASLALLLCYDFHQWIPIALSDIIFTAICSSAFFLVLSIYQQASEPKNRIVGIIALAGFILLFRPSSPPVVIFAIASLVMAFFFNLRTADTDKRHRFFLWFILFHCLMIPIILFLHSYAMSHPDKWPISFLNDMIHHLAHMYNMGIVQNGRLETYHFPPRDILDYALISLHKFTIFFKFDFIHFSFKHSVLNYVFFLPVYGLSIFAVAQLFKEKNGLSPSNWWYIFLCAFYIFYYAFFHALNMVDYDSRYRVACMLPLILLATLGLNEFINKIPKKI
jgi:hypothetical protein